MTKITHLTNISSNSGLTSSKNNLNKWQDFYFKLESQLMTEDLIKQSLLLLYQKIRSDLPNYRDYFILIQFKIKINNSYRSISYLQTIKFEEFFDLEEIFLEF
jgi:hypothetical protein